MGRDQEIHVPYRGAVSPQMRADLTIVRRCATFERGDLEGRQELIENSVVLLRLAAVGHAEPQLRFSDRRDPTESGENLLKFSKTAGGFFLIV